MRIPFAHTAINSLASSFKDYIHYMVYPHFTEYIFAPYQKLVQYQYQKTDSKLPDLSLPLFNYDIQLIGIDEKVDGVWRSTNLTPALGCGVYPPFFVDDDIELRIMNRRYKGVINMNIFAPSYSQMVDIQTYFTDAFYGLNKYVTLTISQYVVIPDSFTFETIYGDKIIKKISESGIDRKYLKIINRDVYYVPMKSRPIVKINSLSENISPYSSIVDSYALGGEFEFEIEMPQYIMALSKRYKKIIFENIGEDISTDFHYDNPIFPPFEGDDSENPYINDPYETDDDYGVIVTPDDIIKDDDTGEDVIEIPIPDVDDDESPQKDPDDECIRYDYIIKTPFGIIRSTDDIFSFYGNKIRIAKNGLAPGDMLEVIKVKYNVCIPGFSCSKKGNL